MRIWKVAALAVPTAAAAAASAGYFSYRSAMNEAERAWRDIADAREPDPDRFDPEMVSAPPEITRRYFAHAIAPGTPLSTTAALEMRGTFLLGDKGAEQAFEMTARQILAPPRHFVWIPAMKSGPMRISGSDALVDGRAWTRFWMFGVIPVANATSSADLVRSATFRSAIEGIWVPSSLLPQNGARWEQTGPDTARVTIASVAPAVVLDLRIAPDGALRELVGQRWSNANRDKVFRSQPFGGTVEAERSFDGFTIPSVIRAGNHYGTPDYLPFFQAELTEAEFL